MPATLMRALAGLLVLLWSLAVLAAPAPLPRRTPPPAALPAACHMLWRGGVYAAEFRADGSYRAGAWAGWWRLEGRVLVVKESVDGATYFEWRARLTADLRSGTLEGGGVIRLEPTESP